MRGKEEKVAVDEILVGIGRTPNVEGLNLETVGVKYDQKGGVEVNEQLQTTNPRIYASAATVSFSLRGTVRPFSIPSFI